MPHHLGERMLNRLPIKQCSHIPEHIIVFFLGLKKKYLLAERRNGISFLHRCHCFHFDIFMKCADYGSPEKGGYGR